jgi:hypothetical protein
MLLPTLAGAADEIPQLGDYVQMRSSFFGCASRDDAAKINRAGVLDRADADRLGNARCRMLAPGVDLEVLDREVINNMMCVRPPGARNCLWTRMSLADKKRGK